VHLHGAHSPFPPFSENNLCHRLKFFRENRHLFTQKAYKEWLIEQDKLERLFPEAFKDSPEPQAEELMDITTTRK